MYGDDGHFESITTTSLLNDGEVEFRSFVWNNDLLIGEVIEQRSSDVVQVRERRTWGYEGAVVVRLQQALSGADDVVQFTATVTWDTAGHALRIEQRDAEGAITVESDYRWDGGLLLDVTSTYHDVDPASAPGCTAIEPRVMRCELTLSYDEAGEPISMTRDGETVSISDRCCSLSPCSG